MSDIIRLSQVPDAVAKNSTPASQILFSQRFNALTNPKQVNEVRMIMRTDVNCVCVCACVNCNVGFVASCDATYAVDVPDTHTHTHTFIWICRTSVLQVYRSETHANECE